MMADMPGKLGPYIFGIMVGFVLRFSIDRFNGKCATTITVLCEGKEISLKRNGCHANLKPMQKVYIYRDGDNKWKWRTRHY